MDFNVDVRRKQLENLNQLISTSKNRLNTALEFLEWTPEKVKEENPYVACPINGHHRILPKSWKNHVEKCIVTTSGYQAGEPFLSEFADPNANPKQTIYLDRNKKIEVITKELAEKGALKLVWNGFDPDPQTSDRLVSTFSSDERLTFYNFCVQNTIGPTPPSEFITDYNRAHGDKDRPLTADERLARDRDAKRRRVKYRSVHIDRKNHTEVLREVIAGQMEDYKEWVEAKGAPAAKAEPPAAAPPENGAARRSRSRGRAPRDARDAKSPREGRESGRRGDRSRGRGRRRGSRDGRRSRERRSPRGGRKSRESSRRRSRERRGSREGRNSRETSRRRSRDRRRSRERRSSRDRKSSRDGSRRSSRERRDRSRNKSRDRSRNKSRDRSRNKSRDRSRNKSRDRSRNKSREKSRDKSRDRSRTRRRSKSRDRPIKSRDSKERDNNRVIKTSNERETKKSTDRRERRREYGSNRKR